MREQISVRQSAPGIFEFVSGGSYEGNVEVSLLRQPVLKCEGSAGPAGEFVKTVSMEKGSRWFTVELPGLDYRPYFKIRQDGQEYITAERTLPVGGMNNFRDMGGYRALGGRTVRWGMLYRSGHFHSTTPEGLAYLGGLGIGTVIDYRSRDEIEKYPNQVISPGIRQVQLDPEAHTAELSAQFTSSKKDEDVNLVNKIIEQKKKGALTGRYDIVMEQYRNFVEKDKCRAAFSRMLKIVAEPDTGAVVQHCRGGKDRTGFGAILLLGILGVGREDLVADYMLTHENRVTRNQVKMDIYRQYTDDPDVLAYLYSLIETRREFIEASLDLIEKKYGGIEPYITGELGIEEEIIVEIRRKYLV